MTEFGVETLVLLPKFGITDVGDSKIALFIIIIITRVDFFIPVAPLRVVTVAVLAYTVSDPPPALSLSPVHVFGTVYHQLYAVQTRNAQNSNSCRKLTCLRLLKRQRINDCVYQSCRVQITHLLIYLLTASAATEIVSDLLPVSLLLLQTLGFCHFCGFVLPVSFIFIVIVCFHVMHYTAAGPIGYRQLLSRVTVCLSYLYTTLQ